MGNDIEILLPDRDVELSSGETVTIREYSFVTGMQVDQFAWPLVQDLHALFDGAPIDSVANHLINATCSRHIEIVLRAVSIASGKSIDALQALSDSDAQALVDTWWEVNSSFFIRRLMRVHRATELDTAKSSAS